MLVFLKIEVDLTLILFKIFDFFSDLIYIKTIIYKIYINLKS